MASSNKLTDSQKGHFQHKNNLLNDIAAQFLNKDLSDLTIVVDSKRFRCHKLIMAARSDYFRVLLYGNLKESNQSEIELKDISAEAFHLLLNYIYSSKMSVANLKVESIFDVFHVAHLFGFEKLETDLSIYLKEIVNVSNVLIIMEKASLYLLASLVELCRKYIDDHTTETFQSSTFVELSMYSLKKILQRHTLFIEEIEIFLAVEKWIKHNRQTTDDDNFEAVLSLVRLPLISYEDLVNVVWSTKLYPEDVILDAIKTRLNTKCGEITFRAYSVPISEDNVANSKYGSEVKLEGRKLKDSEEALNFNWISDATKVSSATIDINLGKRYAVNCIKIHQTSYNATANSFPQLERSLDGKQWLPVSGTQKYTFQQYSMIRFPKTVARHFRVWCAHNFQYCSHIDFIQCLHTDAVY